MSGGSAIWPPEYDAVLIEDAVAFALRGKPLYRYWGERSKVYEIEDEDVRTQEFLALARKEFEALDLGRPLARALPERPSIARATDGCLVVPAVSARDEGAELFVLRRDGVPDERRLVIRLRSSSFDDPEGLLALLRHELYHVADMIDPDFGYEPVLEAAGATPGRAQLLGSRYRVLWDVAIDGRLVREGRASASTREARRREFAAAFPRGGEAAEQAFGRWFDGAPPTHAQLIAFARNPEEPEVTPYTAGTADIADSGRLTGTARSGI